MYLCQCVPRGVHMCVNQPLGACDVTQSHVCMCAVTLSYVRDRGTSTAPCLRHDALVFVHECHDSCICLCERYMCERKNLCERYMCEREVHVWEKGTCMRERYMCEREVHVWERGTCLRERYMCEREVHVWERGMRYDICLCDIVLWLLHMSLWLCAVTGSYRCDRWTDHRVSVVRLIHMSACVPWLIHMCECEVHEPLCVCDMTHSYVCMCAVTHSHVCVGGRLTNWRLCHDAFIRVHVCRDSLIYVRERYTDQFVFVKWHIHIWARVLWLNYICEWEVHRQFWMCDMTHSSKCVRLTCPLPHSPALALTTTIFRIYIYRNHSRQSLSPGFARPVMQVCT